MPAAIPQRPRFYTLLQILSIDVALGALGSGILAVGVTGAQLRWAWYLILPLSVWVMYTMDHLMDAHRLKATAHTPRHLFHHHHFKPIAITATVLGITAFVLAWIYLSYWGILFGLVMGALTALHLLLVRLAGSRVKPWLLKELGVAGIYTLGIWGLPLIRAQAWDDPAVICVMTQFFLLAFVNLLEFSLFERATDAADGHTSFVLAIGESHAKKIITFLLTLVAFVAGLTLPAGIQPLAQIILMLMVLTLAMLVTRPLWFMQNERYRAWGDAAFLLPYLYLLHHLWPAA